MGDLILRVYYNNEWYDLDIDSNIPLRLDVSAVENTSIGEIYGVGSQTFNLPGTRRNNAFFKGAYRVGADQIPGLYNTIDAEVLYNGERLLGGEFQLEETVTDGLGYIGYNVTVADDTVNFKNTVEGTNMNDIDWSAYNTTLNSSSISASWQGELLNGDVFYPLCDFGTDTPDDYPSIPRIQLNRNLFDPGIANPSTPMKERQFLPALSARAVVDTIVDYAGYKYESSLISGSIFDDLFILPKGQDGLGPVLSGSSIPTFSSIQSFIQPSPEATTVKIQFDQVLSNNGGAYNPSQYEYTTQVAGEYEFSAQIQIFTLFVPASVQTYTLSIYKNGSQSLANTSVALTPGSSYTTLNVSFNGTLNANETIAVFGRYDENGTGPNAAQITNFNNSFRCVSAPKSFANAPIDMALQWDSKLKAYDILKGLLTKFNAVMVPHPTESKKLIIENFEEWMNQGRNIDWTSRYDTAQRISIKHPVNEQPKTLLIKDKDDNDRFSKIAKDNAPNFQYGTQEVIADSNIPVGSKKIETVFGPTVLGPMIESGSLDSDNNPTFNLSTGSAVVPHLYKFENTAQTSFQFKPRLGYKVDVEVPSYVPLGKIYYGFEDSAFYSTISNLQSLTPGANTIDLNFSNDYFNLISMYYDPTIQGKDAFDSFWKNYINTLYWDENRKVTLDLEFSPTEYKNIRLNDRIFIHGEQYRINKISGFNLTQDDVVEVELLKQRPVYGEGIYITPTPTATPAPTPTPTVTPANCDFELNIFNQTGCEFELNIS
jgi:hypothetical protein